ncbi:hypothetical protein L226DRAFT_95555 [Lentinus tigrinus ALCF2SS1-7]|uniref:uncharacterized protein n=1 Tax=Lentinus tigrinus ALCF2SS1-7 TaxID=1328758 RepID=UPI001165CF75|nr:hypothetical protein L226DRAFT_95555 [Lentinus tigrinus ALCF2SS1-7]
MMNEWFMYNTCLGVLRSALCSLQPADASLPSSELHRAPAFWIDKPYDFRSSERTTANGAIDAPGRNELDSTSSPVTSETSVRSATGHPKRMRASMGPNRRHPAFEQRLSSICKSDAGLE